MVGKADRLIAPDAQGIARAAELLSAGELVAVPTETVYGLAARADSAEAVAKIYRTKGRPDFNPLIVHVATLAQAEQLALFDERGLRLAEAFWPGPLTMVLPARAESSIAPAVSAGLPTIAVRCPGHPVMVQLLEAVGLPLAAPSANRSLGVSPTRPDHVRESLGDGCPPILDGGACAMGLESTIVALRDDGGWSLLRPGPVERRAIESIVGPQSASSGAKIEAPGQMRKHYSPGKPVRLDAREAAAGEFLIGFGAIAGSTNLSPDGDLAEAAARLYQCLHEAAAAPQKRIAVAPIPHEGMGEAIADRLRRAAA
ncbi:L-threonylcarbamoyladenylate synthase [Aurantiacibacter suaedae]|uniref:L-threonylcarbamoyladenylate synthase n=1 Tax=Aurantiacibacter suaedae TaxID=2545755 RepID=UPI0010F6DBA3|nr:L-threonylcarbamoyladenylate synthase [Aurantiacibacter suaedae]